MVISVLPYRQYKLPLAMSFAEGQWQFNQLRYLMTRMIGDKQHYAAIQALNCFSPLEILEMLSMRSP
tara:strand:- start:1093 stop:1293 length:201 start_codon:yes stop_codon:yes gene_type:complete